MSKETPAIKLAIELFLILGISTELTAQPAQAAAYSCSEILTPSNPLSSPSTFLSALEKTIRSPQEGSLQWLLTESTLGDIKAGKSLKDLMSPDSYSGLEGTLQASGLNPTQAELQGIELSTFLNPNALSVFKGAIFWSGFFYEKGLTNPGHTNDLTDKQPYLEFDPRKNSFISRSKGAQAALLKRWFDSLNGETVRLYRGLTGPQEQGLLKVISSLSSNPEANPNLQRQSSLVWKKSYMSWVETVKNESQDIKIAQEFQNAFESEFIRIENLLSTGTLSADQLEILATDAISLIREASKKLGRDAIFTTPDLDTAKKWGMYGLVAFDVKKSVLQSLSDKNEIFVGIENKIELALISQAAQDLFFRSSFEPIRGFKWRSPRAD
ncbi:MAG: hypothetical protein ACXVCD_19785 [Pseudobdellovibrionaceae bacterium]